MKMKRKKQQSKSYSQDLKKYLLKLAKVQIPIKDEDFQKKIRKLRRRWKIPIRGFKNKKLCKKWLENSPREILKRPKTVEQIEGEIIHFPKKEKIVKEWIPEIIEGLVPERKISKFPLDSFLTDVDRFMIENKIDAVLKMPFLHFLYYNKLNNAPFPNKIAEVSERLIFTKSRKKIGHLISITFGSNARQKDILAIWKEQVAPLQKKIPGFLVKKLRERTSS